MEEKVEVYRSLWIQLPLCSALGNKGQGLPLNLSNIMQLFLSAIK